MKQCACCRQRWPLECYRMLHGKPRPRCKACEASCQPKRQSANVVLGPVPCHTCQTPVTWDGWNWMQGKHRHACARAKAA